MIELKKYYRYEHKDDYSDKFVIVKKMLCGRGYNCFDTPEEATKHFKESEKIALEKYNKIIDGIQLLKELIGDFSIEVWANSYGDTGLDYGALIKITINGYDFTFSQN